jgi:transcriptional regulator with XRE-family HTH domain
MSRAAMLENSKYARLFPFEPSGDTVSGMSESQWDRPQDRAAVGERLRLLQLAYGLNGAEMARVLEIPPQTWGEWLTGRRRIPVYFAARIKREFGCSMDWVYLGDGDANTPHFRDRLAKAKAKGPPPRGRGRRAARPLNDLNDGK